jgi:hypothetical protein
MMNTIYHELGVRPVINAAGEAELVAGRLRELLTPQI